jgi:hypothetical protein
VDSPGRPANHEPCAPLAQVRDGRAAYPIAVLLAARFGRLAVAGNLQDFHRELSHCEAEVVLHHAMRHDFSRWIQGVFRDSVLAETIKAIEEGVAATGKNSNSIRNELLTVIEARYLE